MRHNFPTHYGHPTAPTARLLKWFGILAAALAGLLAVNGAAAFEAYSAGKNYCGPKLEARGQPVPNPIPNQPIPGVNFNRACYEHDKCYAQCSSNCMTQHMCDGDFRARMLTHCKSRNILVRPQCNQLAEVYYQAVYNAGPISYNCGSPPCAGSTAVLPMGTPGPNTAFFFEHANYAGSSVEWSLGQNIPDLTRWNTPTGQSWNDRMSSMKVGSAVRVLAYEDKDFGGRCMTFSSSRSYPELAAHNAQLSGTENWGDRISSLKVTPPTAVCP
jgi:hypothetical protein